MEEFINLHNRTVSRSEVERVISIAKEQNNTEVIYRLSRILNAYPTEQRFVINIKDYPTPPTALAGAHHTGDYREALDDCGRLKKGWKFSKGQVVKVTPKAKKTSDTPTATTAVESKQLVPYTAEKFANDLDINKLERSLHWLSFDPKGRAQREQESFGNSIAELYTSNLEQAKQTGALEAYNDAFDKGYSYILKNYLEMVGIRARTFSTAITGGAGITERKIASNEKLMRSEHERLLKHIDLQEKLQERLAKIAKNTPADQYEEGDVIKSTDNNAITKLQQKLKMLQDRKTMLKNGVVAAKEYQKSKDISVFKQYNIDSETTEQIINHIDKGGKPTEKDMYSWFTMPYLNRDIKEVKNRIATLEKNQAKGTDETLIEGGKIVYNGEVQRLQIFFDGIPSKEVREALKSHAFKWAPTAKAWQRTLTENAKYAVRQYLIKTGILKLRTALSVPSQDDELTFLAAAGIDYFEEAPDDEAKGLGKPVPAADIYKMITDKVISMFKNAKASDYHRAWKDDAFFIPLNFDSKKPYRGVNRLLLQERIGFAGAFRNPYFLTFNQIKKHGGKLKKGTRGYEVVYYSIRYIVPADKNTGRKAYSSTNAHKVIDFIDKHKLSEDIVTRIPMIRYYNVYNGASIEGIDFQLDKLQIGRAVPDTASENQAAALIVENYPNPPAIKHEGNQAYYSPSGDYVKMPKREQFDSINDYYRTLFHELTHSTGHEKRLDRGINLMLEKEDYAKEELVAEFGAVFLSAWAGIMWYNNKNHASYLKGWNSAIKEAENDNKFLMRAASLAQAATDYILNLNPAGLPAFLSKYEKLNKKAEKTKPEAKKATEKADNTDKKYKFIAFYNSYGRINGIYSYQNLTINDFYLKNTFDDGIKVYAPLRSLEKIEEAKRIIEEQYIEGKDFICLKFESKKREEYYSLLIHSNEKPKPAAPKAKKNTKVGQYTGVKTIPLSDLYTDEKRFQNRKKLNEEIVENIVNNFKPTDLDPLVVWYDKKQGKTFVLAGHHRFEALKRLKHKNVPVKFANDDYPTEADAIRYAKEISNANRTLEEPYERAAIYRKYREEGYSEKEINDKAALEGKNRSYILNLSCLNPKGATMSTLVQFSQTQSKADKNEAERVADWIGQARRNAPELTDAHEKEMFDFLMNKEASKRTTTKVKFLEYVRACWNPFEPTAPLNLARMKYQSEGEKQYDEEVERYKTLISDLQNNIGNLKDRFINPANKDFVNPEAPDYMAVKKIADNKIAEYNTQIQYYQKELLKLYSNKQSYLKPTGQIALFGTLPIFKTLKEAKKYFLSWALTHLRGKKVFHKELDKYVVFNRKGIEHTLSSKISFEKMKLILQAEEMLKNSHLITFAEDYKGREHIKGAYRMSTKATLEGEELKVILTLREGENGVIYYDHKIEEIEKSTTPPRRGRAKSFCGDSAPTNTQAKTMPNTSANQQTDKLANPIMPPTVYVEHLPEETNQQISTSANTLDAKMAALQTRNWETFVIANPQLQRFLGDVERKTSESTVITIAGGAGSGKTRFAFQFINALAQNYRVGHASLEEHPDSKLYYDKVQQYIDETALPNIEAPEIKDLDQLEALIHRNEVIVIDSFAKLQELNPRFLLDRDLRKKYDGKLFLLIYQLTGEGKMRGGSKSEYDGDIILLTHVAPDYRENYIYPSKNRYNALPATQLRYSTYFQQMLDIPQELGTGSQPTEAISLPPAPQTNVYEVIY
ncbi:zincin-like metallopeptidase domain-containing protein [Capnocytophaga leadbetteri]|uniref:zincin-like metallopeptidase domain-containing protein n=1 Tax=Capnocytophaga leadbetteri TaxID=327575 RepID=UPI0028E69457|nr:zincin-like metallopeptidase domain-containing protein [Capnocytophaga leadbetteri]